MTIKVPLAVLRGLEAIRESGETNMFDRRKVQNLALEFGYPETHQWIGSVDRATYGSGIMEGFEVE